jgi:hypothetical protein
MLAGPWITYHDAVIFPYQILSGHAPVDDAGKKGEPESSP